MNLFPGRSVAVWFVAAALAGGLSSCGSSDDNEAAPEPTTSAPSLGDAGPDFRDATCASVRPYMIGLTKDQTDPSQKVVAIYRPKQLINKITEYYAGAFNVPASQNRVRILNCVGQFAYADNGPELRQRYGLEADTDDQIFAVIDPA